jgi:hypothetical protein
MLQQQLVNYTGDFSYHAHMIENHQIHCESAAT